MIYGVQAIQPEYGGQKGNLLSAIVELDFISNQYFLSAGSIALASAVDKPLLRSASGLRIDAGADNQVSIIGGCLSAIIALAGHYSMVVEWDDDTASSNDIIVLQTAISVAGGVGDGYVELQGLNPRDSVDFISDEPSASFNEAIATGLTPGDNPCRTAVTRSASGISISVNGGAVFNTAYATESLIPSVAQFGGFMFSETTGQAYLNGYIRYFALYVEQSDGVLPSMSSQ